MQAWTQRPKLASNSLHVAALATAAVSSMIPGGADTATIVAALIASVGVGAGLAARAPFPDRPVREIAILAGSLTASSVAAGLTGGMDSTYTLLPIAAIFLAAVGGGIRTAAPTALLATVGVLLAAAIGDTLEVTGNLIRIPAFYALTAIAFSEAQRALAAQAAITDDVLLAADAAGSRKESLETTHALLEDLVRVATSPNVNSVATAQNAVRDVGVIYPSTASRILDRSGTVLARRGPDQSRDAHHSIPVKVGRKRVATLQIWTSGAAPNEDQVKLIVLALEPVALAIENNEMLLEVAGIAVQYERVRLARELHDDVAPSVASVGLTLDMLLLTDQLDTEQTRNIEATRANVSLLVERIRQTVQDLRADRSKSLTEFAHGLVADVDSDGPTVVVSIEERTPPRPAIAAEIRAMLKEAFRNSLDHASATIIEIGGRINEEGGTLAVQDNGIGFDTESESSSRFGLVGMKERATLINAEVSIVSEIGRGTLVSITWRDRV